MWIWRAIGCPSEPGCRVSVSMLTESIACYQSFVVATWFAARSLPSAYRSRSPRPLRAIPRLTTRMRAAPDGLCDPQLEPAGPAGGAVPPGAVDQAVGADDEQVDVLGDPRDGRDVSTRLAHAAGHVEPAGPAAGVVPPGAVDAVVGPDGEQVEVEGVAGDRGHGRAGRGDTARDLEPRRPAAAGVPPG